MRYELVIVDVNHQNWNKFFSKYNYSKAQLKLNIFLNIKWRVPYIVVELAQKSKTINIVLDLIKNIDFCFYEQINNNYYNHL